MIIKEFVKIRKDNVAIYKRYSDDETKCLKKVRTDEYYDEAYDIEPCPYDYEEVDKPIIEEENEQE